MVELPFNGSFFVLLMSSSSYLYLLNLILKPHFLVLVYVDLGSAFKKDSLKVKLGTIASFWDEAKKSCSVD
jgi:hypothetical protein